MSRADETSDHCHCRCTDLFGQRADADALGECWSVATKMIAGVLFPVFVWGFIISSYRVPVSGSAESVFLLLVAGCASSRN